MSFDLFIQNSSEGTTTLTQLSRVQEWTNATETLSLFAYATQSGLAAFDLAFGESFWNETQTRWLFGIDYGRTHPQAIRSLMEKPNAVVRVHDGNWVVNQAGFLPRQDFHPKTSFFMRPNDNKIGVVAGSGNFSSNGLRRSVEAGTTVLMDTTTGNIANVENQLAAANEIWNAATPAGNIILEYEQRWQSSFYRQGETQHEEVQIAGPQEIFWIEAGYVTRNRGADKPGNQIDLPRGMSRYFGMNPPDDLPLNTIIGSINFITPANGPVERNLRLGNNSMEKITLPIPEQHGFDIYDGKVLVFRRSDEAFVLNALEPTDFEATFGDRLTSVVMMSSGRRYGHIV